MNAVSDIKNDGLGKLHRELSSTRALPALDAWRQLAKDAVEPNAFFAPEILLPALQHLDLAGEVAVLHCWDGDALAGLMPVIRSGRYRGAPVPNHINWRHANCFLGTPLVLPGREDLFWTRVLSELQAERFSGFLRLEKLTGEGSVYRSLRDLCAQQSRPISQTTSYLRAMLQSESDPETYLVEGCRTKKRKEWRRRMKRLHEQGQATFHQDFGVDGLRGWLDDFLRVESSGWKRDAGTAIACDAANQAFFLDAMTHYAEAGKLERRDLRLDGRPIAMLVNLYEGEGAFSFKTAYDENFAAYSPGVQLEIDSLSVLDKPGVAWTDSCAAPGHPMIDQLWQERREIVSCNVALGGAFRQQLSRAVFAVEGAGRTFANHMASRRKKA